MVWAVETPVWDALGMNLTWEPVDKEHPNYDNYRAAIHAYDDFKHSYPTKRVRIRRIRED